MGTELEQGDQFLKSKLPADNGYGQNGYTGASSVTPGNKVSSNFLPEQAANAPINSQTREVTGSIAAHPSMRNRNAESKNTIPANGRPVKK
jgi:hypothetical protein